MESVLLTLVVLGVSVQSIAKKAYNQKVSDGVYSFSAASMVFAIFVFLAVGNGSFEFDGAIMPYALLFALSYSVSAVASFVAIAIGSLSLTSLIIQYSLILPTFYGMLVLNEPITLTLISGLVLLCISLVFVNLEGKEEKKLP